MSAAAVVAATCGAPALASQAVGEFGSHEETSGNVLPMMLDPVLEQPTPQIVFDRRNIVLWLAALKRPEFDVRISALDAFAAAHRQGVTDLQDAVPAFEDLLAHDPHQSVRSAAAQALIDFDHRSAASSLQAAVSAGSPDHALVIAVDSALARWDHAGARAMWVARLASCREHPTAAVSAIQSLAKVQATEAGDAIIACVRDVTLPASLRLEAARALPSVRAPGRSDLAAKLAGEAAPWGPLMALLTLGAADDAQAGGMPDPQSLRLVEELTANADARVRALAVGFLRRASIQAALAKPQLVHDPDEHVRLEMIRVFAAAASSDGALTALSGGLDDVSEPVRTTARKALFQRSKTNPTPAEFASAIGAALTRGRWRESEQAAILAGELHLDSEAEHLAALLTFDRPEVRIAAATALRELSLPSSLPALMARAQELTAAAGPAAKDPPLYETIGKETAQIFMAFAQVRHRESVELLEKYIPKRSGFHPVARGAAIYALGKIFESQPQPQLHEKLLERANDSNPLDPEAAEVRRFSAVSLARMGAKEALPTLRELYDTENTTVSVGGACRWAIMHMEKAELPPCRPISARAGPFFIESIEAHPPSKAP
ncbi:MAG: HEAT repeat domain-containing protein [Planctomycetes bacterium]|nr:HEAT repeat domain-containing protein [Planctomycetota bacterium]